MESTKCYFLSILAFLLVFQTGKKNLKVLLVNEINSESFWWYMLKYWVYVQFDILVNAIIECYKCKFGTTCMSIDEMQDKTECPSGWENCQIVTTGKYFRAWNIEYSGNSYLSLNKQF